jgi:endothelin-converting enzyme/putative endopeptidase
MRHPVVMLSVLLVACGGEPTPPPAPNANAYANANANAKAKADANANGGASAGEGPDEAAMDRSVSPCDDFYQFACGGWMKATPIPEDESRWVRSFNVIQEKNELALRDILERHAAGKGEGAYAKELGDYYAACMDEDGIEKAALAPIKPELDRIAAVKDAASLTAELAHLHGMGISPAFRFDSEIDAKDATQVIAQVAQGGTALPERAYYLDDDAKTKQVRSQYEAHVARTFELVGDKPAEAARRAKVVLRMETELARSAMTRVELRDPKKTYHRLDLVGLEKDASAVRWKAYLDAVGLPGVTAINVAQPEFAKTVSKLVASTPMSDWRTYLEWHFVRRVAAMLGSKFVDEDFAFQRTLTGAQHLPPRWKRCVREMDSAMGEALAQPFVKDHLGEDGKRMVQTLVAGIEGEMKLDLESLAWMDDATRARSLEKLAAVRNKIGFPDKWRSYDGLVIGRTSFVADALAARAFEVRRQLAKIGKPVDKSEWEMTPPTVNAYYEPPLNEIVFPAGILQPPMYSKTFALAMSYGAIGMVVGHEITHGFDDAGRQYDAAGNLRDWWTPSIGGEFDKRAACVEKQFDEYIAVDDVHVKGKLTLGENIADLGGLKLSHLAYEKGKGTAHAAGGAFTDEQQFFLGFAQGWCGNTRPEAARLRAAIDPHSPPRYRVNGPLSNSPEFAAAFACKEGSPMVRPKDKRCEVW